MENITKGEKKIEIITKSENYFIEFLFLTSMWSEGVELETLPYDFNGLEPVFPEKLI